jgi:hypothetical protein
MKRLTEFDVLRGVLLLIMVVDHSPSSLRRFTDQPLGFFTTAECFVFISAFLAGMLFRKRVEKTGFAAARSSTLRRAWRIYGAHMATLAFTFTLGSLFLSEFPPIANLLDHYLMNPWAAIGGSFLLLFRPPLMDILPMYVLLSLLTPVVFWVARNWRWRTVLLASLAAWLISQTHARETLIAATKDLPFVQLGPFDLLAWQILWVGGLYIGQRYAGNELLLPKLRPLRPLILLLAIAFLFWRWRSLTSGAAPVLGTWLLDKWHLGPLRLINFALAVCATAPLLKSLNRWEGFLRPLFLIGRHMLPVFSIEICVSVVLIGRTDSGRTAEPITSLLVICQLVTAPVLAWLFERHAAAKRSAGSMPRAAGAGNRVKAQSARFASPGVPMAVREHAHAS